jgi:hypothetical protein
MAVSGVFFMKDLLDKVLAPRTKVRRALQNATHFANTEYTKGIKKNKIWEE